MKTSGSITGFLLAGAAIVPVIGLIAFWLYWWFAGLVLSTEAWIGFPWYGTLSLIILIWLFIPRASLILTIAGFIGWVWILNWAWITGLIVYLPTAMIMFTSLFTGAMISSITFLVQAFSVLAERIRGSRTR